jgi:acetolactate synthase I/III small subunit
MRHIIAILLQNEAGALARVAGMFSSRGYNIDSLSVAPTHDPAVSRLTLVTSGSDAVIHQILQQTRKVVDVVEIIDLSARDHLELELVLVKVAATDEQARRLIDCARRHHAVMLDETDTTRTVQSTGTVAENDAFLAELADVAPIIELVRSGVAALERGPAALTAPEDDSTP